MEKKVKVTVVKKRKSTEKTQTPDILQKPIELTESIQNQENDLSKLTQSQNIIEPKIERYKIILYNILGAVVGFLSFYGIFFLASMIFGMLLESLSFRLLFSGPSGAGVLLTGTIMIASSIGSLVICNNICKPSANGKKAGLIIYSILLIILGIFLLISFFLTNGISVILISYLSTPVIAVISFIAAINGKELKDI